MIRPFGLALLAAIAAAPAAACLPPPPGSVEPPPPTPAQRAHAIGAYSQNIVYGVLTRGTYDRGGARLRVLHVYKGPLRRGSVIAIRGSWGFDAPPCAGMMSGPPPVNKGAYGVVAWSGEPELNFVSDDRLNAMFAEGLIRSARQRVGTGSGPE